MNSKKEYSNTLKSFVPITSKSSASYQRKYTRLSATAFFRLKYFFSKLIVLGLNKYIEKLTNYNGGKCFSKDTQKQK